MGGKHAITERQTSRTRSFALVTSGHGIRARVSLRLLGNTMHLEHRLDRMPDCPWAAATPYNNMADFRIIIFLNLLDACCQIWAGALCIRYAWRTNQHQRPNRFRLDTWGFLEDCLTCQVNHIDMAPEPGQQYDERSIDHVNSNVNA